jgi:hypothetical protein
MATRNTVSQIYTNLFEQPPEIPLVDGVPSESIGIALYVDANTCPSSPFDYFYLEANARSMGQNIVYNLES